MADLQRSNAKVVIAPRRYRAVFDRNAISCKAGMNYKSIRNHIAMDRPREITSYHNSKALD